MAGSRERISSRKVDYDASLNGCTFDKVQQEFGLGLGLSNRNGNDY